MSHPINGMIGNPSHQSSSPSPTTEEMADLLREQRHHSLHFLQALMKETLRWNVFLDQRIQYEQYQHSIAAKKSSFNGVESASPKRTAWHRPKEVTVHLEHGPDLHLNDTLDCYPMGINSLLLAIENESWSYVTMLIDIGVNIEQADEFGETALIKAAKKENLELIQILLDHGGADINSQSVNKETALMHACRRGCTNIVHHLLCRGADHSLCNSEGETVLHMACHFMRVPVVQKLLEFGVDVTVKNNSNATAKDQIEFKLVMDDTPKVREIHRLLTIAEGFLHGK